VRENPSMHSSTQQSLLTRNLIVLLCVALPWLNPFASSPSTAVIPLLVSWMMAACALLAVVELPLAKPRWTRVEVVVCGVLLAWLAASLLWVPQVVDRALTMGLVASLMCVWLMAAVGRRAAADESLLRWLVAGLLAAAVISAVLGVLQYLGLARELSPWVNQPLKGDAFANLRQRNQFACLTSLGLGGLVGAGAHGPRGAVPLEPFMAMVRASALGHGGCSLFLAHGRGAMGGGGALDPLVVHATPGPARTLAARVGRAPVFGVMVGGAAFVGTVVGSRWRRCAKLAGPSHG